MDFLWNPVGYMKKHIKDFDVWNSRKKLIQALVLPLTTHKHSDSFHKEFVHDRGKSWVMLTQIRTVDSKRLLRKLGTISHEELISIQNSICAFITSNPA